MKAKPLITWISFSPEGVPVKLATGKPVRFGIDAARTASENCLMARAPAPLDILDLEADLTTEQRQIQQSIRTFVERHYLPTAVSHFRAGTFPMALVPELGRLGVFGANLHGYGCAGVDNLTYGLMMAELEAGDSGLRSFASVQGTLSMYPILTFGSEAQRERWLPGMAKGEILGCFGLTEANHGSDPAGMETRAERHGKGYRLNGQKLWITNGTVADLAVVWAKLDGDIRGFIVPKGAPGFAAREIEGKWSLRASITAELTFDDAELAEDALLPEAKGLRAPLACLTQARYGIIWGVTGALRACLSCARDYAIGRQQFGRPLAAFQLVQQKLAEVLGDLTTASLVCHRLAKLKDAGKLTPVQVSLGKRHNVAAALKGARICRELLGANGITDAYPVIRHLMNLETVLTYEGTHDIHTLVLGDALTGLPAYS
jgi:glutaryl-CoA dehydrogenase